MLQWRKDWEEFEGFFGGLDSLGLEIGMKNFVSVIFVPSRVAVYLLIYATCDKYSTCSIAPFLHDDLNSD